MKVCLNPLKREFARGSPYSLCIAPGKIFLFYFIISNERSDVTIVKSKISSHLVLYMKNASKNKLKGSIFVLKTCYLEGAVSILTFSH